jgi:hypothetical protein
MTDRRCSSTVPELEQVYGKLLHAVYFNVRSLAENC